MKSKIPMMRKFIIFSLALYLLILLGGGSALYFSMRQIIRTNKGNELSRISEIERLKLQTSVNAEITVVLKLADSPVIRHYFADTESRDEMRETMLEELESTRHLLASHTIFWIDDTDKIFHFDGKPDYLLDPEKEENYWYYKTIKPAPGAEKPETYNWNINYNPDLDVTMLWINAPVFGFDDANEAIGMVGTGFELTGFINSIYRDEMGRIDFYLINREGEITGAKDIDPVKEKIKINDELAELKVDIMADIAELEPEGLSIYDYPGGKIGLSHLPLLDWYSVAVFPDSIADYYSAVTVLFLVVIAVIAISFVVFNIFIAGLLRPLRTAMDELEDAFRTNSDLSFWYQSILDSIPVPVSVTDADMKWTFVNKAVEDFLGQEREDMIGLTCDRWNANICGTEECGIACAKRGLKQTFFTHGKSSYQVNVEVLKDKYGNTVGFIEVVQDITEAENSARSQAEAESTAKSIFLATMSHEMRTPLNAIIGMTAIGKQSGEIENAKYALGKIEVASVHLLGVINDVLDMSKIEANKLELSPVSFSFEHMLQKVITVINFRMEEKHQVFSLSVDDKIPKYIVCDDQRLAQIITNLLSNAVKFTPEKGSIALEAILEETISEEAGRLRISVTDSGIGISDEQQEKLFSAFVQAKSGISREYGGTGLGLTISKRIVELMGGMIWVESKPGKGAKFIFTAVVGFGKTPEYSERTSVKKDYTNAFAGKRLLLVEDIEINREIIAELLSDSGITIETAENGAEAVDMVKRGYDIILMDMQMPVMDGLEASRRIRALGNTLPIIAMTANVFKEDIESCIEAGMDGHIGKPIDIDAVLEKLGEYLD